MPAIAMGLIWGGYTVTLWGYCLVRGYNVTLAQLANPRTIYKWSARMPEIPQGMLLPGKQAAAAPAQVIATTTTPAAGPPPAGTTIL
jgi:hypothetical protein